MVRYTILYRDIRIGVLEINENGQYKYTPNQKGIEKVKEEVSLTHEMLEETSWREAIPFFKNRLEDAKKFGETKVVTTHRDFFKMELEES